MVKGKEIRRSFSREFKREAVRRIQTRPEGVSVAHIGRELGVRADILRAWLRQLEGTAEAARPTVFPGKGRLHAADEELRRLQRENARLRQENDFLKKAAAYFAQEGR
jgi:transposase